MRKRADMHSIQKALKALGVDPAVARELGYPLKDSEEPESNFA
jgi:hypothetical protein